MNGAGSTGDGPRAEGLTIDELLALSPGHFEALVLTDDPIAFRFGTAEVLARFRIERARLVLELAHIDGGGEGVLPTIARVARAHGERVGCTSIEWVVHAINCARPSEKLRRVLVRRGFEVRRVTGIGNAYHLVEPLEPRSGDANIVDARDGVS